jgi:hypothetical protein
MKTLSVMGSIVTMTVLAGIALLVVAASLLLVQSASATIDVMTTTTTIVGEEEEEGAITNDSTTTTTNNVSNALLGNLFYSRDGVEENVNSINETYSIISYSDSVMIMPPNALGVVINATETGDFTVNIQPNGLSIGQGQGFITTEDGGGAAAAAEQEENATVTFVSLSRLNPDGTGSGTGVVFFSTNSTGQLAFLDNMIGITQIEFSPEGSTGKIREWKGGSLAPENGEAAANGNLTTTSVS